MKKTLCAFSCLLGMILATTVHARGWIEDLVLTINANESITHALLGALSTDSQRLLAANQDIDSLMKDMNGHITGHSGWGMYQFHDYQSYGGGARDWANVIQMAEYGQGAGELGGMISGVSRQFPANTAVYNRGVSDANSQRYYALKSQTILAARAASQLDYNKIQDQIAYQQMLQQQIEQTKDLKAAIDLSNRIQVEGNLINLEILRQAALTNQQQAISEQASVNTALTNAKFLTKG